MVYTPEDERYMRLALEEAEQAFHEGATSAGATSGTASLARRSATLPTQHRPSPRAPPPTSAGYTLPAQCMGGSYPHSSGELCALSYAGGLHRPPQGHTSRRDGCRGQSPCPLRPLPPSASDEQHPRGLLLGSCAEGIPPTLGASPSVAQPLSSQPLPY